MLPAMLPLGKGKLISAHDTIYHGRSDRRTPMTDRPRQPAIVGAMTPGRSAAKVSSVVRRPGRPPGSKRGLGKVTHADEMMAAALELFAERNFASVTIK